MASTTQNPSYPLTEQHSELDIESRGRDILSFPSYDELRSEPKECPTSLDQDLQWVSGFKLINIIAAVTLVSFLMFLDTSIISTAIPRITNTFHSTSDIGWYGSAYQISSATLQPLTGRVYMNFKAKWTFMSFFAIFEVGSLICAVASSSKVLIIGRAVSGIGTSGIMNGAMTIIAECVPLEKRPTFTGIALGVSQLGLVSGPLIGGVLTQYVSWRWCFYINLPIGGLVALMLAFVHIPTQIPKPPPMTVLRSLPSKLDLIGFAIFAPASIMLLLALQYGGITYAWYSSQVLGLFIGAAVTFVIFLIWDYLKGDEAIIPRSIASKRTVWTSCLVYGFQAGLCGVDMLPNILLMIVGALISGRLLQRIGFYIPITVASAVLTAVASGLISTFSPETSTGVRVGYQILLGFGRGLGLQMPIIAVQNTTPPAQLPLAMALIMFSQSLSGALVLSFASVIFSNSLKTEIPNYAPGIDPQAVADAGATGFREVVPSSSLPGVLTAYAKCIDRNFYLAAGLAVGCFIFAWGMGWKDVRKKKSGA